jgi:acid phosphatase class B
MVNECATMLTSNRFWGGLANTMSPENHDWFDNTNFFTYIIKKKVGLDIC